MNAGGGEWCAKCTDLATVDGWWQNAILALVGESLGECSEGVTGVRMVDKSDGKQGHVGYRIEVWYDKTADATAIHDKLTEVICEGITADKPKFQKKAHPAVVSKAPAQKGGKGGAAGVAAPRPEPGSAAANQEALDEQRKVWQRQVRSIMAKITPEKAARLAPQLAALIQGVTPAAEGVDFAAQLIHKNALHEGLFAETYSGLCEQLDNIKTFREAIVTHCKKKFASRLKDVQDCDPAFEATERKAARANARFIVELFKRQLVAPVTVIEIGQILIKSAMAPGEHRGVHVEILCELFTHGGQTLEKAGVKAELDACMDEVAALAVDKSLEPRHRFTLEALAEQQRNRWQPRREKEKPKTKEEVEQEARQAQQNQSHGGGKGGQRRGNHVRAG